MKNFQTKYQNINKNKKIPNKKINNLNKKKNNRNSFLGRNQFNNRKWR